MDHMTILKAVAIDTCNRLGAGLDQYLDQPLICILIDTWSSLHQYSIDNSIDS